MRIISLNEYMIASAKHALSIQQPNGTIPAGHNGPWQKIDTPVRTTAHWAVTFAHAYHLTGTPEFKNAAKKACDYLNGREARPSEDVFYCRENGNDKSNGLIGQAWAVEPLLKIGFQYGEESYIETALDVLNKHPYCEKRHGWKRVDLGGKELSYATTINQQIWFAAMALQAGNADSQLKDKAMDFLNYFPKNVEFIKSGLIKHRYNPCLSRLHRLKRNIRRVTAFHQQDEQDLLELSNGYLSFILYGLAMIENILPKEESLQKRKEYRAFLHPVFQYAVTHLRLDQMQENRFAWAYNPTGIELAFALQTFRDIGLSESNDNSIHKWLKNQFINHASYNPPMMNRNTSDPAILSSRLYEATVLDDIIIT